MPRGHRQDYPGAFHHVMNRGARRAPIFRVQRDCQQFLEILGEVVERFEIEVHAYSLMPNHYHLLIRSRLGNLSDGMRQLNQTFTQWLNHRHRWDGPVFRGRFKSQLVDDEEHLRLLVAYIHLNPVAANLIRRVDDEGWTSFRGYLGKEPPPDWLTTSFFLALFGGRRKLRAFVESYRLGRREYPDDFDLDTGLFAKKAIARPPGRLKARQGPRHGGPRNRPAPETLRRIEKLTGADLAQLRAVARGPRANPPRRFAIWALDRATALNHRQVAELLNVSYHQVGRVLTYLRKNPPSEPLKGWMEQWIAAEG